MDFRLPKSSGNLQQSMKKRIRKRCVFLHHFLSSLSSILGPKSRNQTSKNHLFWATWSVQAPRGPKSHPRVSQERKNEAKRCPNGANMTPKAPLRAPQDHPRSKQPIHQPTDPRCFDVFFLWIFNPRALQIRALVEAKRSNVQNRHFRFETKNLKQNHVRHITCTQRMRTHRVRTVSPLIGCPQAPIFTVLSSFSFFFHFVFFFFLEPVFLRNFASFSILLSPSKCGHIGCAQTNFKYTWDPHADLLTLALHKFFSFSFLVWRGSVPRQSPP